MADLIVGLIVALILSAAVLYIYKSKKRGDKCVGCPYSKECGNKNCKKLDDNKKMC